MNIWVWRLGRLAWCGGHYDEIIRWQHLFWRLWWRKSPSQLLLEQVDAEKRAEEVLREDWWEKRKREALAESRAVDDELAEVDAFAYVYDPSSQVTELSEPGHIPIPDTDIIRPRAP